MKYHKKLFLGVLFVSVGSIAAADFVDDEFNSGVLEPHWTFYEGVSTLVGATTTTLEPAAVPGHMTITVSKGADSAWDIDNGAYLAQDQPEDSTWEIQMKVNNWDPRIAPNTAEWQKVGLQIHQDNNHWVTVMFSRSSTNQVNMYTQSQFTTEDVASPLIHKTENTLFAFGETTTGLYLRLQKTSKGYRSAYSVDGVEWIERGSFVRNPHSADGFLSPDSKIRIITSAAGGAGDVEPVEIDWIRKEPHPETTVGYADDEFDGSSLADNWLYFPGVQSPTVTSGTMVVEDGKVKLTPNASGMDVGPNAENIQFIMQDAPDAHYISLSTRANPTNFTASSSWSGHGIRLWQDQNHWIMVKVTRDGGAGAAARNIFEARHSDDDGAVLSANSGTFGTSSADPGPEYMRIEKEGTRYRLQYSFDNLTWVNASNTTTYPDGWIDFGTELQNAQVQLFVKRPNAGGTIIPSEFDYIEAEVQTSVQDWQLLQ